MRTLTDYKTPVLCGNGKTATMIYEAINSGKKIISADKIMELSKQRLNALNAIQYFSRVPANTANSAVTPLAGVWIEIKEV